MSCDEDERVEEMFAGLEPALAELDPVKRAMIGDMMRQFCWYSVKIRDLEHAVEEEGMLLDTEKGVRSNPAIDMIHKLTTSKANLYAKVLKEVGSAPADTASKLSKFASRQ